MLLSRLVLKEIQNKWQDQLWNKRKGDSRARSYPAKLRMLLEKKQKSLQPVLLRFGNLMEVVKE